MGVGVGWGRRGHNVPSYSEMSVTLLCHQDSVNKSVCVCMETLGASSPRHSGQFQRGAVLPLAVSELERLL